MPARAASLRALVGSGDRVFLPALLCLLVGVPLNAAYPSAFAVGGPSQTLRVIALVMLAAGVVIWLWSVVLILVKVPKGELITTGPFALVKHPLYTGVALLVFPSVGLLLDTWLGLVVGVVMYFSSRRFAPEEEKVLAEAFGTQWDEYRNAVTLPWL
jgi:protein-S-isoprenylcysteine O-methyltransferase Ste14